VDNQFSFDFANLHSNPFGPAAAQYPYLSSSFQEVLAALYYGLEYGNRILIVSAERGMGKSTLLSYLERRLRGRSPTLLFSAGRENGRETLRKILSEISGAAATDDLLLVREQVDATLERIAKPDRPFILLLDYDDETGSTLDVLCLLATLESMEKGLLRVVVAIHPTVAEALRGSGLADEVLSLSSLKVPEVESYIDHRLRTVGCNNVPRFTSKACALIAAKSSGRPSSINEICLTLLQNLPHFDARANGPIEEGVVDDFCVESLLPGQNLGEPTPGIIHLTTPGSRSFNHMAAVLACIVVMLGLALGGMWYRSAITAHTGKEVGAGTGRRSRPRLQPAALRNSAHGPLATASPASNERHGASVTGETGGALNPATPPPAVALPLQAPLASAVASQTPVKAATTDMTRRHVEEAARPPLLSAGQPISKNPRQYPVGGIDKPEQDVVTALPSGISLPSTSSASSSAVNQKTPVPTAAAGTVPARERKKSASGAAQEMAAYNIRLGDAYMKIGDYEKARSSFARAAGWAPDSREALDKMRRAERAKAAEDNVLR
jgi:general secretion pathway protein A